MSEWKPHTFVEQMRHFQTLVHDLALEKGWWDKEDDDNIAAKLALVHSEISEMLEEARTEEPKGVRTYVNGKPEGFGIEAADAVIRLLDLCGRLGIDLGDMLLVKHSYNNNRPYRHGKRF